MKKYILLLFVTVLPFWASSSVNFTVSEPYNHFKKFPLPRKALKRIQPHLLPYENQIRERLDQLFLSSRVSQDIETFEAAGFYIRYIRPTTHILVASHHTLPGCLLKLQLDTELRNKHHMPNWEWLIRRCEGAEKIRNVIQDNNLLHFTVPFKWMYPLPLLPAPLRNSHHKQKFFVVVVEDMNLVPYHENLDAWKWLITKDHLDELYLIISNSYSCSFRPDNIWLTRNGQFAFIDTEYLSKKKRPQYKSIRPYLSPEMLEYWDQLVGKD